MTLREEEQMVRLRAGTALRLRHRDPAVTYEVDCRMLFMGDRLAAVERVYREVSAAFAATSDPIEVRRELAASSSVSRFYEIGSANGSVAVTLRDEIFREPGPADELPLVVEISNRDRRLERSLSPTQLCALGALLPLLTSGGSSAGEIGSRVRHELSSADAAWVTDFVAALEANGLIETGAVRTPFFRQPFDAPRATLLGHSSLLVQSERGALLVDPVLRRDHHTRPEAFDIMRMQLDAIVCSHAHWDHCDLQTLLWFDKRTPILIPRHRQSTVFNPPIGPALARLGFSDIREVDHWVPVRVGDFEIVPIPFRGEQDEPGAEIDHYTYVIRTAGLTLYGGVDCYRDTFGDMFPVLERVRELYHPTVAFLPISKMIYDYGTGGVNGFCRFLDDALFRKSFQYTASAEDAAQWVAALQPRWVCPYAIFTFSRWSMNPEIAEFAEALRRLGQVDRLFPLRPLDALDRADLAGGNRARTRRALRVLWCSVAPRLLRGRRLLDRWRGYRLLRRIVSAVAARYRLASSIR